MEDVGLWQAYEAQASLQQQAAALMYNNVGPHHPDHNNHIASVADHGGCVPQSPAFLPCWNDSSSSSCRSWLDAAARSANEINDMSMLMCTPSSLHLVDTGVSLNHHQRRRRRRHPSRLIQQHQQLDQSSSSSLPELSNMLCQSAAADGLWGGSHNSSSSSSSLATELYGTGPAAAAASAMHKLMQVAECCYSHNSTVQGPATESMSMAAASNCALQQSPGYCNNTLQASSAHGLKPNGESAAAAAAAAASSYGAAAAYSMQRDKKISALQAPVAAAGTSCRKAVDRSSSHSFSTVPGGMYATGGGGGTGGRDCRLEGTNLLHPQQQQLLQLPIVPGGGGITGVMNSPACGSSSAASLGGFSPSGNGGVAAATNVAQQEIQRRVTGIAATTAAGGMKSMASFNPGPYVSSAAAGERQDSALAAHRVWLENKGGSSSAPTTDFNAAQQLACGSAVQRIAGSKQQQQQQQQPGGIKSGGGAATQVPGIEWSSRMSPASAAAAVAVGAVQQLGGSRVHTGLQGPVDEKTTSIVLMQQPETAATTTTTLKCALPRCPPAASSGNTAFTNPRKRSILQGDSFQGIFQDSGKKSAAAGGMLWSGQDHGCSRLEYLSTAAHKQVSQSTATSGSSRALGPALNTNLKPRARQGSANDPQSIAARVRRERISERLKYLQALIPNGDKVCSFSQCTSFICSPSNNSDAFYCNNQLKKFIV
ncbi:hypothetical protein BDL97_03G027400 [Sphagnum fallax]|nr:hypothetical protein BDL97_03G027400 [Sphagnum fallax]